MAKASSRIRFKANAPDELSGAGKAWIIGVQASLERRSVGADAADPVDRHLLGRASGYLSLDGCREGVGDHVVGAFGSALVAEFADVAVDVDDYDSWLATLVAGVNFLQDPPDDPRLWGFHPISLW